MVHDDGYAAGCTFYWVFTIRWGMVAVCRWRSPRMAWSYWFWNTASCAANARWYAGRSVARTM